MPSGKVRLYEYVRDHHDKLLAVRQGQKGRIGHLLVINGLLTTAMLTFMIPSLAKVVENSHHPIPLILVGVSAVVLIHALIFLGRSLMASLSALASTDFHVPTVNDEKIEKALVGGEFTEEHAAASLTPQYLQAIRLNYEHNVATGIDIHQMIRCTRIAVVIVLVLAILVSSAQFSEILLRSSQQNTSSSVSKP
jgi:hypothetical protein